MFWQMITVHILKTLALLNKPNVLHKLVKRMGYTVYTKGQYLV